MTGPPGRSVTGAGGGVHADTDDAALVGLLPHDHDAFDEFYRRHLPKVMGFAARRTSSPEELADPAAATFVAVLEESPGSTPGAVRRRRGSSASRSTP